MAKKNRSVKVCAQSGYKYRMTPTIMLKGQWLKELGFEIGDYVSVSCEDGKLIITPDTERATIIEAKQIFMEREMKALEKKCQSAQFVAEENAKYGEGAG